MQLWAELSFQVASLKEGGRGELHCFYDLVMVTTDTFQRFRKNTPHKGVLHRGSRGKNVNLSSYNKRVEKLAVKSRATILL